MKKIIGVAVVALVVGFAGGVTYRGGVQTDPGSRLLPTPTAAVMAEPTGSTGGTSLCEKKGGTWLGNYRECENISENVCKEIGGIFNECSSACRHSTDPKAICTMNCVPLCTLN